nr:glucanase [synthetic construct]
MRFPSIFTAVLFAASSALAAPVNTTTEDETAQIPAEAVIGYSDLEGDFDVAVLPFSNSTNNGLLFINTTIASIAAKEEGVSLEKREAEAYVEFVSAKDFSGAELYTLEEVQYGKFEARMKMAAASGTVSSMFLYQNGSEIADGRPWVEVDIEVLGKNPGSFQSNIITGKAGAQKTSEKHHAVSPAADQAFHTYGLEWTPNYVRWTVDGQEVRKTEGGQVSNLTGTQGLRFNLWSSESAAWVGQFDESKLPLFQFINWVKVYKYTPGQGEGGSDFTLDWTDNFDTFDGSRWGKGDWTFDGNRVDLTDKNIYSRDGMLILALTRKGQESFNGQVPRDDEPAPQSSS